MYENPYMGNQYMQQIPRYNGMQYQQMQQPVYQNPVQQSPTQQQAAVPQLIGRTVNSVDEITANDVPMNYPYAIFPKNDPSEVYLKSWTPNGTIQTIIFKPEINPTSSNTNRQERSPFQVVQYLFVPARNSVIYLFRCVASPGAARKFLLFYRSFPCYNSRSA